MRWSYTAARETRRLAWRSGQLARTISYELLCAVGKRVPRYYLRHGRVIKGTVLKERYSCKNRRYYHRGDCMNWRKFILLLVLALLLPVACGGRKKRRKTAAR